jgi:hypothetical protein
MLVDVYGEYMYSSGNGVIDGIIFLKFVRLFRILHMVGYVFLRCFSGFDCFYHKRLTRFFREVGHQKLSTVDCYHITTANALCSTIGCLCSVVDNERFDKPSGDFLFTRNYG